MWKMLKAAHSTHWRDAMNDPWEMGIAGRRKMLPAVSWGFGLGQDTLKEKWKKWLELNKRIFHGYGLYYML